MNGRAKHLVETCLLARLEGADAERIALRSGDTRVSYRRLAAVVAHGAADLEARLGPPGEGRVILASKNQLDVGLAFLSLLAAGRVPVLADPTSPESLRRASERWSAPLVADATLLGTGPGVDLACARDWLEAAPDGAAPRVSDVGDGTEAFWVFTSGTTGEPKPVVHGHRGPVAACEGFARGVLALEPGDVTVSTAGLPFVYALGNNFLFPLMIGASCILPADLLLPTVLGELVRHEGTVLVAGPWSLEALARLGRRADRARALARLRRVLSAGEPLPASLFRRWNERFGGEILDNLGCTEMFNSFVGAAPGSARPGVLGRPAPGFEIEIGGGPPAPGGRGALRVRGGSRAIAAGSGGGPPELLAPGGWCETGDEVEVDAEGRIVFLGRLDDRFKVHGQFVSPVEVERSLLAVEGVRECLVSPARDEHDLVVAEARIVPAGGVATDVLERRLREHARRALPAWKRPVRFELVDSLPRSPRGKLRRGETFTSTAGAGKPARP